MMVRRTRLLWITTPLILLVFMTIWHSYIEIFNISRFILPTPIAVIYSLGDLLADSETYGHALITVYEALGGFILGCVLGVALGAILGKLPILELTLSPFIVAMQVVPKIALIPLFILWFGFGSESKIFMAGMLAFFPIFSNTLFGVKSVDLGHKDVMTSLNSSLWQTFRLLEFPSALPAILSGMEIGMVFATVGAVVGEFMGGSQGLGFQAVAALLSYEVDRLFGVLILLTVVGFNLYFLVLLARRLLIPWHESVLIGRQHVA